MKTRLLKLWDGISSSFWFVPTLTVLVYAAAALLLLRWDRSADRAALLKLPGLFHGGADSARAVLSVVAQSTITVMGVVFSVTIVALTLASTQYTPRVLYTFTRDRGNQLVMGILIGTFTYSLLVLRAVRSTDEGRFVPPISVTGGLVLALVAVGALIYFIHHISTSIHAATVISNITSTTQRLLTPRFPASAGTPAEEPTEEFAPVALSAIPAEHSGYVQIIDGGSLMAIADEHDLVLHLERGPGDFVVHGSDLLFAAPPQRVTMSVVKALRSCFAVDHERSMQQDPEFGIRQLMDIAVKALSPSVNDPTTAIGALDHLASLLVKVATEEDPSPWRAGKGGIPRMRARGPTFASMLGHALDQIRQHAERDVAVTIRLIAVLREIGARVTTQERRDMLWEQAAMIAGRADEHIPAARDRARVNEMLHELAQVLMRVPDPLLLPTRRTA